MGVSYSRVCILGATGHIAQGLIFEFSKRIEYKLFLFTRSPEILHEFLAKNSVLNKTKVLSYNDFNSYEYDVIINCIGVGDPQKLKEMGNFIIKLTEDYDNLVFNYLCKHNNVMYINFSSGAAYGTDFNNPADEFTKASIDINRINSSNYYGISKVYCELKHRANEHLNIVDLRIFGYFSRFIKISAKFLICDIIRSIINGDTFITNNVNINRDYLHFVDLFSMIEKCINIHCLNDVYDLYSLKQISKFEILNFFTEKYGLKYEIKEIGTLNTITGAKLNYYSNSKKAENVGYNPIFSSLDTIIHEMEYILN